MNLNVMYLTQEEFDALSHYETPPPPFPGTRWRETGTAGAWTHCEYDANRTLVKRLIQVVSAEERVKRAVEEERGRHAEDPKKAIGPKLKALSALAPEAMGELTQQFIERKNLNERATIRLRMKAILDLFSADTGYPPIPAISADQQRGRFGHGVGDYIAARPQMMPGAGFRLQGEAEQLQQEVAEAVAEEDAAAAPADVAPAPGAPVVQ